MHSQTETELWQRTRRIANEAGARFSTRATLRGVIAGVLGLAFVRYLAHSPVFIQVVVLAAFSLAGFVAGMVGWVWLVSSARRQFVLQARVRQRGA
jgi:hypothetical protein